MSKEAHDKNVAGYEAVRQASVTASSTAAQVKTAEIVYYKSVLASGQANGVRTGAMQALINLGAVLPSVTGEG